MAIEASLLAGVGRCDITPAPGTPQGGWGAQIHERGTGADMFMLVTALALVQGDMRVLVIDVDAIGFDTEWTSKILNAIAQLTGVPKHNIRFSCSHTHAGPNTFRLNNIGEGLDMAMSYLDSLPLRIAGAAWQALEKLVPVRMTTATGLSYINRNRRVSAPDGETVVGVNEEASADHSVGVVRFDCADGRVLATVVHYACHPTTCGWQNTLFSPDYPGPVRQTVERELGGTCLFLQGAAGDLGPRRGFTGDLSIYRQLGHELGLVAASLASSLSAEGLEGRFDSVMPSGANIAQYVYRPRPAAEPVLAMRSIEMQMPIRRLASEEEVSAQLAGLWSQVQTLRTSGRMDEMRRVQARATQMGWRLANAKLYGGRTQTPWPLQVIRIGDMALVSMAGEPFSSIGIRIRERSPARFTFVSGYSNGGFGYIPDRDAYLSGGYEVEATPFSEEAARTVVETAVQVLNEMF